MTQTNEIQTRKPNFIKNNLRFILPAIIFVGLFAFFSIFAAGPRGSDELLYADIGLRGYGNYIVMNRYTHIYLEALFMALAPTPLIGIRFFWGFVMSLSSVSVYLIGRYIRRGNNIWHGVIALLIFLSGNLFERYFGIPIVDLTTMMMVMVYILVLLYLVRKNDSNWVIILLGAIFFWAFKAKEFSVILLLSLPAFGFTSTNEFKWKKALIGLGFFALGVLAGSALFMLVNAIVLGDPLFSFRISDMIQFRATISSLTSIDPDAESYLQEFIWSIYYLSFTLYLMSYAKNQSKITNREKIIWLIPVAYLFMMVLLSVKSGWRIDERYLYPVIGIIAALAPQYFDFKLPEGKKAVGFYLIGLLICGAVIFGIRFLLYRASLALEMTLSELVLHHAIDFFFLVLLIAVFVVKEKSPWASLLIIVLIGLNVFFSLSMNLKAALRHDNLNEVNNRFAALVLPEDALDLCPEATIEISAGLLSEMDIHPDPYEAAGVINIFFDTRLPIESFSFMEEKVSFSDSIDESKADYIFMTTDEWEQMLVSNPDFDSGLYNQVQEDNHWIVILENGNRTSCQVEP